MGSDKKTVMNKKETSRAVDDIRELSNPSLLRIPKRLPQWNYRFVKNTPEDISLKEAMGYEVANGDIVRESGLKPREDGTYKVGDLILMVEPWAHHKAHKDREAELKKRQDVLMRNGVRRPTRRGEWGFDETVKQS